MMSPVSSRDLPNELGFANGRVSVLAAQFPLQGGA